MRADCHMHMVLDSVDWKAAVGRHVPRVDESYVRSVLARWRDAGFTYLRDGGDMWGVSAFARSVAPEYGIVYRTPLAPISKKGHYGGFIGEQFGDMRQYAEMVALRRQQGADLIKIMISGLMDFHRCGVLTEEGLDAGEIRQMVHIAHEEGFAVMAHANGARTVEAAAAAGVDSVEHGAYLDADALAAMEENGVIWVPTLSTVGNLLGEDGFLAFARNDSRGAEAGRGSGSACQTEDFRPHSSSVTACAVPPSPRGKVFGRFDAGEVKEILEGALENVRAFSDLGGIVAAGSDAGAWAVPHAVGTEYTLLARAGVTQKLLEMGARKVMERFVRN